MQDLAALKPAGKVWCRLVGGRVEAVRAPADTWLEHGATIVDTHPGVAVAITKLKVDAAKRIASRAWLPRLRALDLEGAPLAVRTVLAAAGPLTRLALRTGGAGIDKTLALEALRTVEALELRGLDDVRSLARAIAEHDLAGRLVRLRVGGEDPAVCGSIPVLEVEGLEALVGRPYPKLAALELVNLALQGEDSQRRAADALARLDAPVLRDLHVDVHGAFVPEQRAIFRGAPGAPRLTALTLRAVGTATVEALAQSPLATLQSLVVRGYGRKEPIATAAVNALVHGQVATFVARLSLEGMAIPTDRIRQIFSDEALPSLRALELALDDSTPLVEEGVSALLSWPRIAALEELAVRVGSHASNSAAAALALFEGARLAHLRRLSPTSGDAWLPPSAFAEAVARGRWSRLERLDLRALDAASAQVLADASGLPGDLVLDVVKLEKLPAAVRRALAKRVRLVDPRPDTEGFVPVKSL